MNRRLPAQLRLSLHVHRFQIWSIPQKRIRKLAQLVVTQAPIRTKDTVCKQDRTKPNAIHASCCGSFAGCPHSSLCLYTYTAVKAVDFSKNLFGSSIRLFLPKSLYKQWTECVRRSRTAKWNLHRSESLAGCPHSLTFSTRTQISNLEHFLKSHSEARSDCYWICPCAINGQRCK